MLMLAAFRSLWGDEAGSSQVEYALLVAVVAVGCISAWTALRAKLIGVIDGVADTISAE